jgi:hypothetical protein
VACTSPALFWFWGEEVKGVRRQTGLADTTWIDANDFTTDGDEEIIKHTYRFV